MEPQFRILGPLEAAVGERIVEAGGAKPRRLLAMLLIYAGKVVSADRLVDAVWDDDPPASAKVTLRTHVASLRRSLGAVGAGDLLVTRPSGYCLRVTPEQVDAHRFERLVEEGRAALGRGDPDAAAQSLHAALELWRGAVLEDLDAPRFAHGIAARLEELRLVALENRIDADLAVGRHAELIGELEALVDAHPFRERPWGQLMLALYRAGRQVDALEAYRSARRRLDEELGLAPGQDLSTLEAAILRHDPALAVPRPPAPPHEIAPDASADQAGVWTPAPPALFDVVHRAPMVGRRHELDRLVALWEAVRTGARRVALVSGEAGVGKTRLVAELAALATEQGAVVLVGHCEQAALIPYQPLTEALQDNRDVTEALAQAPQAVRDQLGRLLHGPTAPQPSGAPAAAPAHDQHRAFLDTAGELFTRLSERTPTLFVVEDAERIDRASARLLGHLVRRLPERMLLLLCFRDPPGSRHLALLELLADLESRGLADRLALDPLPEADLAELVVAWTGTEAPAQFVRRLWSATGGNPFFASEVVRDLAASDALKNADEVWRVPTAVRDVLRERLHALSPLAGEAIACAAVLGREVDVGLLAEVADQPADEVIAALEQAADAGWLVETERAGAARYAFRHLIIRQAVHADIPAPRRQRLHLRAANALEAVDTQGPADRAAIAVHLRAAGSLVEAERAAGASLQAAAEAAELYAWDEAIAHAEAAVAILSHAGAPPAQQGDAAAKAAEIRIRSSIDLERAIEHFEYALQQYRAAGDEPAIAAVRSRLGHVLAVHHSVMDIPRALEHIAAAEAVLTEGEAAFDLHSAKALAAMFGLRIEEGCAASEQAVHLATGLDRQDLVAWVRPTQATLELSRGRVALAYRLVDEAWATAQEQGDPRLSWGVVIAAALMNNIYLLDPATGQKWCRRGLAQRRFESILLAHESVTDHLAYALGSMGRLEPARKLAARLPGEAVSQRLLLLLGGDWETAEQEWSAALEHDLDNGDLLNAALNAYWLGEVRWLLEPGDSAVETLRRALAIITNDPQIPTEQMVRAELARCLAALGDVEEAAQHLARCDEILAEGENWGARAGHVELARAAVAAAQEHQELANAAHDAALRAFTACQLPWWRSETLLAWAGWLKAANRPTEAEAKRRAAWQLLDELGAPARWRRSLTVST